MKIVVVGLGYVGLSNLVLLAQKNEVVGVDISEHRIEMINNRISPLADPELKQFLAEKELDLVATKNLNSAVVNADYVIVSTPTNYDEKSNYFDTSTVEDVIENILKVEPKTCIVVKSTVPVGFIQNIKEKLQTNAVMFSPEFLREGRALYDNLYPNRIVV